MRFAGNENYDPLELKKTYMQCHLKSFNTLKLNPTVTSDCQYYK